MFSAAVGRQKLVDEIVDVSVDTVAPLLHARRSYYVPLLFEEHSYKPNKQWTFLLHNLSPKHERHKKPTSACAKHRSQVAFWHASNL